MKRLKNITLLLLLPVLTFCALLCGCAVSGKILEENFFLSMTNIQSYPNNYADTEIDYDCFTYLLTDINGNEYICGVRHCSSGYGCNCGNDTIIGFLLEYDGEIPAPRNQSAKDVEKTWVHITGKLKSTTPQEIKIHAYKQVDGGYEIDYNAKPETIKFLTLAVSEITVIEDYQNLKYYVTK